MRYLRLPVAQEDLRFPVAQEDLRLSVAQEDLRFLANLRKNLIHICLIKEPRDLRLPEDLPPNTVDLRFARTREFYPLNLRLKVSRAK